MSNPSRDLLETQSTLLTVIESLIDGQEGFKSLGEELKNPALKEFSLAESLTRAQFRGDLETILHQEGVRDVKESGSAVGTVLRTWGSLKAAFGAGDEALLATAEEGEDAALEAYEKARENDLPLPVRQLLTSQEAHIQATHDYIKAARDSNK